MSDDASFVIVAEPVNGATAEVLYTLEVAANDPLFIVKDFWVIVRVFILAL